MATYNIQDLTVRNGRLYAGNVEVGAHDMVGDLPAWALTQDRISQIIGQAPDNTGTNDGGSMFDAMPTDQYASVRGALPQFASAGDYYRTQIDPVAEFAGVGSNRDALYGAYMVGQNDSPTAGQEELGIANGWGKAGTYYPTSQGLFDRDSAIPDLATQWSGEAYSPMNQFISPVSAQSAQDVQAILKQFYPNVSQADMDKAAYAAMQEGQWYYNGYKQPAVADSGSPYYGFGPLPVVTAIANKLGGVTPELGQFFDQNWSAYSQKYGEQRHDAKAAASAETQASDMANVMGGLGVVGGAFGLSGLLNGGLGSLGSLFGEGATTGATGGNMGLWDSITSGFSDFGNSLSNLLSGGSDISSSDFLSSWMTGGDLTTSAADWGSMLGDIPSSDQFLNNWLGTDPSIASPDDWGAALGDPSSLNTLIEKATSDPLGSAAKLLKALTSSGALGSLLSSGLGAYAANQQSGALEDMAKRYEGYGAPYRQRLANLYANPDSFLKSNEVQKPVQMGTDNLMRSLSMQGNPFGSGNALQQGQSYASDQLFSRLGQEKDRLAGFGGLASYNAAAPAANANAIQSTSNAWNALGSGVNNIFNPPQTPAQQAAEWMRAMGSQP